MQAAVLVALPALLGVSALAIDLGMLYVARSEAQRAADAAALAGASAFVDYSPASAPNDARQYAWERALDFASQNAVRGKPISVVPAEGADGNVFHAEDVTVEADLANNQVKVWVRSQGHGTFFGRLLGITTAGVTAMATAQVAQSGTSACVVPIFIPDAPDIGDLTSYDPVTTGYGSDNRNGYALPEPPVFTKGGGSGSPGPVRTYVNDFGRRIPIWPGPGGGTEMGWVQGEPHPSLYGFFKLDEFGSNDAASVRAAIEGRQCLQVAVGDTIWTVPGGMSTVIGPNKGFNYLWDTDPYNTHWDSDSGEIVTSHPEGNWRASPRVFTVALVDPRSPPVGGPNTPVVVTNFTTVILDDIPNSPSSGSYVSVRLVPVAGQPDNCSGAGCGSNVRRLRLVQ